MIINFLLVGLGGFLGSVLRYSLSLLTVALGFGGRGIPVATLIVNVLGSLLIGYLMGSVVHGGTAHLLAVIGFCGGFTTFSTFSLEVLTMIRQGDYMMGVIYVVASLMLCILAVWIGAIIKT